MIDSFKSATSAGGDYLNYRELAADGPVLALFRIISFLPGEPTNYPGAFTYPVVADVLICDGPRAGEVNLAETIKYAPSNVLRGVSAKASAAGEQPTNAPGEQIAARVVIVKKQGGPVDGFIGLDPVSATEREQVAKVWDDGNGWAGKPLAAAGATTAGEASGTSRPWK